MFDNGGGDNHDNWFETSECNGDDEYHIGCVSGGIGSCVGRDKYIVLFPGGI